MTPWLTVVGIGEDGYAGLGKAARQALLAAEDILGAPRQLALLPAYLKAKRQPWPIPFSIEPVLARRGQSVCVLASGDPLFFGVGATLAKRIPVEQMQVFPSASSCSLAAARLGWPLAETTLISLVGRPLAALNLALHAGNRLLVLSQDGRSPAAVAELLCRQGFGGSRLQVFEHLGGAQERRLEALAQDWSYTDTAPLNLIAVECQANAPDQGWPVTCGLPDTAYQHDGQLTKRDVRAITLARLAPRPNELLWDVGAGCGSIGIEWLRSHPRCRAIAIEADVQRAQFIRHNREALGVPHLHLVEGRAPEALKGLVRPEAIFIGGGVTEPQLLEQCWQQLKLGGRLVANAVTLQSQSLLMEHYQKYGGELIHIQVAQAQPLGSFDTWRAALPITLWVVHKSGVDQGA